jgi:hypothetical protein
LVGTGYASLTSLPGDVLYPIKTSVVEEVIATTHWTPLGQLEYQQERFEARFDELRQLQIEDRLSLAALDVLSGELTNLSVDMAAMVQATTPGETAESLVITGNILAITTAVEQVVTKTAGEEVAQSFEVALADLETAHSAELDKLLDAATSTIESYIGEQLEAVFIDVEEGDASSSAMLHIEQSLIDTHEFLEADEYAEAVTTVSNAALILKTDEYLDAYVSSSTLELVE